LCWLVLSELTLAPHHMGGSPSHSGTSNVSNSSSVLSRLFHHKNPPKTKHLQPRRFEGQYGIYNLEASDDCDVDTFCTCLGHCEASGRVLSVTVYHLPRGFEHRAQAMSALAACRRHVTRLLELQLPFPPRSAPELDSVDASDLFVNLVDFSTNSEGEPGLNPGDTAAIVVSEQGTSLTDYMLDCSECSELPARLIQVPSAVRLVRLGLEAKGFSSTQLKPEHMMLCGGQWKLFDVLCAAAPSGEHRSHTSLCSTTFTSVSGTSHSSTRGLGDTLNT